MLLRRITWIAGLVIIVIAVALRVTLSANNPGQGAGVGILYAIAMVMLVGLACGLLGLVLAIFPRKDQRFGRRLWLRLPFAVGIVGLFALAVALLPEWWEAKQGLVALEGVRYDELTTPSDQDCQSVHDGVFENEGIRIERQGDRQHQSDKTFGYEEDLTVTWLSPCEYELKDRDPVSHRRVKITKVDANGYDCVVEFGGAPDVLYTVRLERVRE